MDRGKPIGARALISLYWPMAAADARLRQLKAAVDYGEVRPNVPQMGRFFGAVGAAQQIATKGRAPAKAALQGAEATMKRQ